jgi:hypothetical protein
MALRRGALPPENEEQRNAEAQIGPGDVAVLRARVAGMTSSGEIDGADGEEILVAAGITRGMLLARRLLAERAGRAGEVK